MKLRHVCNNAQYNNTWFLTSGAVARNAKLPVPHMDYAETFLKILLLFLIQWWWNIKNLGGMVI